MVHTMIHHANSIMSDPEDLTDEKDNKKKVLNMNGYPDWIIILIQNRK